MADEMKVEILRRETIKPYSPTPDHLRIVRLSMLDQIMPDIYIPRILYYPFSSNNSSIQQNKNPSEIASQRLQHLRESLSKTLTLYYPFAGRLRNNGGFVECNDEGAEFIEARTPCMMSKILKNPDLNFLTSFIASQPESEHEGSLFLVQATVFSCGGIAVGLSLSHKLGDTCTFGGFIRNWAKIAQENSELLIAKPEFGKACNMFPPIQENNNNMDFPIENFRGKCVTKRYIFTSEKIAALKKIYVKSDGQYPTRVEAVTGLLWKCALKALSSRKDNSPKVAQLCMAMNIRQRVVPPFGDHVAGNLVSYSFAKADLLEHEDLSLQVLVDKLRKGINEAEECFSKEDVLRSVLGQTQKLGCALMNDDTELYTVTSWSRFGSYEADFGWETPTWVSIVGTSVYKNAVLLMDTKDGDGIETWVTFSEEDTASIESNREFLAFASLNPSVV